MSRAHVDPDKSTYASMRREADRARDRPARPAETVRVDDARPKAPTKESLSHAYSSKKGDNGSVTVCRDPLDHYRQCRQLAPGKNNAERNKALWQAGDWFRATARAAGLNGLSAIDYNTVHAGDGDPAYGMPTTEYAMGKRMQLRRVDAEIRDQIGRRYAEIVHKVVVEGMAVEDAVCVSHTSIETRRAFGLEFLRVGLDVVARYLGIIRTPGLDPSRRVA